MDHFQWRVETVSANSSFAEKLQATLNAMEAEGFEIDDIMDAPEGRQSGVVVIAKKPRGVQPTRSPQTGP